VTSRSLPHLRGPGVANPMTIRYVPARQSERRGEGTWPSPPNPGDLSRRLELRREELRLSCAQVAARAGINQRYLEYLERYPATPAAGTLRRIAAALLTTPAALLGAGWQVPDGHGRPAGRAVTKKLLPAECRRLMAPGGVGRIGLNTSTGPVVLPVNFAIVDNTIVVRTSAGTLVGAHADESAAFEVDHIDEALCQGWSVLVRGRAHQVVQPAELRHLQDDAAVWPWAAGDREVYVRIVPDRITGRRIETQ
jgi:nitroimidazol reductase NimA-like FMN-containing flavoprotein (pyridoxamine 5'-phosphate oxidase superfamily)